MGNTLLKYIFHFFIMLFFITILPLNCAHEKNDWLQSDEFKSFSLFANKQTSRTLKYVSKYGSLDEAIQAFETRSNSNNMSIHLALTRLYLLKGSLILAKKHASKAQKLKPLNIQAKILLAQIYFSEENYSSAQLILKNLARKKISKTSESEIYNVLAGIELRHRNHGKSLEYLNKSLKISNNLITHMNLGIFYLYNKNYKQALKHFLFINKKKPNQNIILLHIGICFASLKKYDQAYALYQKILDSSPTYTITYYNLAVLEYRRKNYSNSRTYLKSYIKMTPKNIISKKHALNLINAINSETVSHMGISDEELNKDIERLTDNQTYSRTEMVFGEQTGEINTGFMFSNYDNLKNK